MPLHREIARHFGKEPGEYGRLLSRAKGALGTAFTALALAASIGIAQAETEIRTITSFASNQVFARELMKFVETMNGALSAQVKFRLIGGPEAMPPPQLADAVKNGIVDAIYTPASFYRGQLPEVDALSGSTKLPWQARESGGFALLDRIYQEKLGAKLLAWPGTGFGYHLFLKNPPKRKNDGSLDLGGVKLRSAPVYREFFSALGIVNVVIQPTEIYVAMERGVVEGVGWPALGVSDLGWDRFIKYRVDPPFLSGDAVIVVNLRKWQSLAEDVRQKIEDTAKAYEKQAVEFYQKETAAEFERLAKAGVTTVELSGDARRRYLEAAYAELWERLQRAGSPHAAALKAAFYQ